MSFVDYENKGAYSIITINNPSQLNALNSQVLDDLNAALDQIDVVYSCRLGNSGNDFDMSPEKQNRAACIVVGGNYCAGACG